MRQVGLSDELGLEKIMGLIAAKRIYQCDHCKKTGEWSDGWRHKLYLHMKGLWDETITVCSEQCADSIDMKRAKGRALKKYRAAGSCASHAPGSVKEYGA
jgi:hypothetical protein